MAALVIAGGATCAYAADNVTGNIGLDIPVLFKIYGIKNLDLGTYTGAGGGASDDDDVCVWNNQSSGNYRVRARGSGSDDAFTLSGPGGQPLPYQVRWNNTTGTAGNVPLGLNTYSSVLSIAARPVSLSTCSGSENANFQVTISQTELLKVRAGVYTGVLTLEIAP